MDNIANQIVVVVVVVGGAVAVVVVVVVDVVVVVGGAVGVGVVVVVVVVGGDSWDSFQMLFLVHQKESRPGTIRQSRQFSGVVSNGSVKGILATPPPPKLPPPGIRG